MKRLTIADTKIFMAKLLKGDTFDSFELRSAKIQTFATFTMDGAIEKDYYTLDEQEALSGEFSLWGEIRPLVFHLIKGTRPPKSIRLVLSLPKKETEAFHKNAKALFLNLAFENGQTFAVTGCSQREFSLAHDLEYLWDEHVKAFFSQNGIPYTEEL